MQFSRISAHLILLALQTSYDASEEANFPADEKKPSRKDQEGDLQFPDEVRSYLICGPIHTSMLSSCL